MTRNILPPMGVNILKSVRVHFAYGRIALTLELLGRFGRFLDQDDHCNPPVLVILFFEASRALNQKLTVLPISKVWTTGMLVAGEGPPDKRAGAPTSSKVILTTGNAELRTTPPNWGPLAYLYCFLKLNFSSFGLYMNIIKSWNGYSKRHVS